MGLDVTERDKWHITKGSVKKCIEMVKHTLSIVLGS